MEIQLEKMSKEDKYFISAIQQEVFNRILSTIRHDLVGYSSASLIRVSIMNRLLNKAGVTSENLKPELSKIEDHLKSSVVGIRALAFWDFNHANQDFASNILARSVQLISTPLMMKNIGLNVIANEYDEDEEIETKPLLYTLLCLFSYFEDNYENHIFEILPSRNSMTITNQKKSDTSSSTTLINRYLHIDQESTLRFAKLNNVDINFEDNQIKVEW